MKVKLLFILVIFNLLTLKAQQHGVRGGCYNTTWPLDMANSNRSNCVTNCGFTANFDTSQVSYSKINLPFPVFSYSRDSNEVFVMGGCPLILYNYGGAIETGTPTTPSNSYSSQFFPYIAKLNLSNLSSQTLNLSGGSAAPYIGGAVIHSNGLIYAVASGRLFKIQSSPFQVLSSTNLPTSGLSAVNFFNGLGVSRTGRIVAKTYNQITGQGNFLLIDENNLTILYQLSAAMASPRLTIDINANKEYIYHLNQNETYRIEIVNDSLIQDANWTAAYDPYNDNSTDEPTSPVIMNNQVFYTTNTIYSASRAMKIFWQDKSLQYDSSSDTLTGAFIHSDTVNAGWSFFHLSVDDTITSIIIGNDQGAGKISAGIINANNSYQLLWEKNMKTSARPIIVADRNLVYANDYSSGYDHLVVLDLQTGNELGRIKTDATKPTIGTIIITPDDYIVYASNEYGSNTGIINIFKQNQLTAINSYSSSENIIQIYPNPYQDILHVACDQGEFSIQIFDIHGKLVFNNDEMVNKNYLEINTKEWKCGQYCLIVNSKTGISAKHVIKIEN